MSRIVPSLLFLFVCGSGLFIDRAAADVTAPVTQTTPAAPLSETTNGVPVLTVRGKRRMTQRPDLDGTAAAAAVPRQSLDKPGAELTSVLEETPGVQTQSDGSLGGFGSARIRGANGQHTRIFVDGIPLNSAHSGLANPAQIPLLNVDAVHVYRSNTPLGYGTQAIGGIVDIRTRRPDRRHVAARLGAGSFGRFDAAAHMAQPLSDTAWTLLGLAYIRSEGDFRYVNDKGTAFDPSDDETVRRGNNHGEQFDGLMKWGVQTGEWELQLTQSAYGFRGGLPGNGLRPPTQASRDDVRSLTYIRAKRPRLGQHDDWRLSLAGYYGFLRQRQNDPQQEFGTLPNRSDNRTHSSGLIVTVHGDLAEHFQLQQSLNLDHELYNPRDDLANGPQMPRSQRTTVVWSMQPQLHLIPGLLSVYATGSYVFVHSDARRARGFGGVVIEAPPQTRHRGNYRAGLLLQPLAWLDIKANVGSAHREPSLLELFGDSGFVQPSRGLRPERSLTMDAGVEIDFETKTWADLFAAQLFLFHTDVDDLIQLIRGSNDTFIATNFNGARIFGIETGLQWTGFSLLQFAVTYDYLASELQSVAPSENGRYLPLRPQHRAFVHAELFRRDIAIFDRVATYVEYRVESENYVDSSNTIRIPPRSKVDLGLRTTQLDDRLSLGFVVRNVGNNRINDLIGYPLPGRSYIATATYQFL